MASQKELDSVYMQTALTHAMLSKAVRAQVGAVLVTSHGVTLTGYNGTAKGRDNCCEVLKPQPFPHEPALETKPEVIHAELNCILKAAREGVSCIDSTVYVTLAPCVQCSAMMVQAGVKRLVYKTPYRDTAGLNLLEGSGVRIQQYSETQL
jgi:dCMP deaminase